MKSPDLDYRTLSPAQSERHVFDSIYAWAKMSQMELGLMCIHVRDQGLWNLRTDPETGQPCSSWTRWLQLFPNKAYSTLHAAVAKVELLKDVPALDLKDVLQENVGTMIGLSTAVRNDPEVLAAAKTQKASAFIASVSAAHPGQHLSPPRPKRFHFTAEQRAEVDEAIALAIQKGDASSPEQWAYMMAIQYKQECEEQLMNANNGRIAYA